MFCGSSPCSCKFSRFAHRTSCHRGQRVPPHCTENPLCPSANWLCKSFLGSCSSDSASLVPGAGICSSSPLWLSGQGLQLWSTAAVNPSCALLAGTFPALCLWQPLQSSLKLHISLGCGFDVSLPSQTSETSVFIWKWYPSFFFFFERLQCSSIFLVSPNNQLFPLSCRLLSKTNLFDCEKLYLF